MIVSSINEYDVKSCDINILKLLKVIDEETYIYLQNIPKLDRNIYCGNLQRDDKSLNLRMTSLLKEIVDEFIEVNDLHKFVFDIVKDAVWVYRIRPKVLNIRGLEFRNKRSATSILKYKDNKLFYNDSLRGTIFSRGFGEKSEEDYPILKIVKKFMSMKENELNKEVYKYIHESYLKYINNELSEDYYNSLSGHEEFNKQLLEFLIYEL